MHPREDASPAPQADAATGADPAGAADPNSHDNGAPNGASEAVAAVTWAPPEEGSATEAREAEAAAAPLIVHRGPPLGDLLMSRGALTSEILQQALQEQTNSGRRLGETLVEQGIISEGELVSALAEQLEWELVDLRRVTPEPHAVVLVDESLVRAHRALPVDLTDDVLVIAVSGPMPEVAVEELRKAAGKTVRFKLAPASDVERAIDRSYDALSGLDRVVATFQPGIAAAATDGEAAGALVVDENAPIVQIFQRILTQAVRERASDLHIEPQADSVRIRFRVDGALHDAVRLPAVHRAVAGEPDQDPGRDEHRRATARPGRPVRGDGRRTPARRARGDDRRRSGARRRCSASSTRAGRCSSSTGSACRPRRAPSSRGSSARRSAW